MEVSSGFRSKAPGGGLRDIVPLQKLVICKLYCSDVLCKVAKQYFINLTLETVDLCSSMRREGVCSNPTNPWICKRRPNQPSVGSLMEKLWLKWSSGVLSYF